MSPRSNTRRWGACVVLAVGACLAMTRIACGWGVGGHQFVAALAVEELPRGPLKDIYQTNLGWLETNSSFPDRWKGRDDLAEPARHFFHPEAYGFGSDLTLAPHTYGDALKKRSYEQMREDGVLPWTIERHYKLLVNAWSAEQWDEVLFQSAILAHYVADAHEPMHTAKGASDPAADSARVALNTRFTDDLVSRSIRFSDLKPNHPLVIKDPLSSAFAAIESSSRAAPSVIAANHRAVLASGGAIDDKYWQTFDSLSRPIAVNRLQTAGQVLSGMLLSAWKEAGRPSPPANFIMSNRYIPYAPENNGDSAATESQIPPVSADDKDAARQSAHSIKIASKILNRDVSVTIILPADYESSARRYPTLYLLHGSAGNERDWVMHSGIAAYVHAIPLIVVMPDGGNSWYLDSPGQGKYEDFFVKELIPQIDRTFRTQSKHFSRAIAGNSMGGYGAWRIAIDHPDLFSSASALSGALDMGVTDPHSGEPLDWITSLYGGVTDAEIKEYNKASLYTRIDKLCWRGQWHGPALYFDAGSTDYLLSGDRHMEQFLMEKGVPYEFSEFEPGDHNWQYWDEHIRDVLQFTLRHLAPPSAH